MKGPRRCIGYDILGDDTPGLLADRVQHHMRKGWEPAGGLAITVDHAEPYRVRYFQAIAQYTEDAPFTGPRK